MRTTSQPNWARLLLVLVGLVVLGPPALALLATTLGMAIAVGAVALKVGAALLIIWAFVSLVRGMFGASSRPQATAVPEAQPGVDTVEDLETMGARLEREERERREALDRQLAEAIRSGS